MVEYEFFGGSTGSVHDIKRRAEEELLAAGMSPLTLGTGDSVMYDIPTRRCFADGVIRELVDFE